MKPGDHNAVRGERESRLERPSDPGLDSTGTLALSRFNLSTRQGAGRLVRPAGVAYERRRVTWHGSSSPRVDRSGSTAGRAAGFPTAIRPSSRSSARLPPRERSSGGTRRSKRSRKQHLNHLPTPQNSIDGHAVVTRKNGDKLRIHYTGLSPAPSPDDTGVGHLDDDLEFVIEGGTGRFENATGSGRLTATGDVYYDERPTVVSSQLKGTIELKQRDPHDDDADDLDDDDWGDG